MSKMLCDWCDNEITEDETYFEYKDNALCESCFKEALNELWSDCYRMNCRESREDD